MKDISNIYYRILLPLDLHPETGDVGGIALQQEDCTAAAAHGEVTESQQ